MSIRWLWFDYVDPSLPLTRAERKEVRRRVKQMHGGLRGGFNKLDIAEAVLIGGSVTIAILLWWFLRGPRGVSITVIGLYFVGLWLLMALVFAYTRRPLVLRAIHDVGYDICLKCGYWLRGLDSEVKNCPECGSGREELRP